MRRVESAASLLSEVHLRAIAMIALFDILRKCYGLCDTKTFIMHRTLRKPGSADKPGEKEMLDHPTRAQER